MWDRSARFEQERKTFGILLSKRRQPRYYNVIRILKVCSPTLCFLPRFWRAESRLKPAVRYYTAEVHQKAVTDLGVHVALPRRDELHYSTIARGAKVTRHTVAKWYETVREMMEIQEQAAPA